MKPLFGIWILLMLALLGCQKGEHVIKDHAPVDHVKAQMKKLAPVTINFDHTLLNENEMQVLRLLVRAAQYMDNIFLEQVYGKNTEILRELEKDQSEKSKWLLDYFRINFGPFDRLDHDKPFINISEQKPSGANYYPEDMTKEEFLKWLQTHPEDEQSFTSNYTIIRREGDKLVAIPYSEAYKHHLKPAAELLMQASELAKNPSLKKFLKSRAEAFLSNDYFQSDMDWVDLKDHKIEIVIGPYEVYEDNLFGYKAAFESFITIVDPDESKKLAVVGTYLDKLEQNLPIPDRYKNFNRGKSSPILVVQEVFTAGDTKAGIQTTAFNLPNDERVREAKGSKKVMLKNIARAKFDHCWIPIVNQLLDKEDLPYISFDAYFNHVLLHEMAHGLGPGIIEKNGEKTTVNKELKELYSTIEEAKADILGVYNLQFLIDEGVFPKELEENLYISFLGGIFRSVRFGINEAHGGANAISLNYILEKGGFEFDKEHVTFKVNKAKIKDAVKALSHDLLMIQAEGSYEKAKDLIEKYRIMSEPMKLALAKVKDVPVDIRPHYAIEEELN
ncbi:MAG: hypothetical protein Kow00108_11760 [Calditrichia bacterium]